MAAVLLLSTSAACGSDDAGDDGSSGGAEKTLTVYAAASLTSTFTELGKQFEADHDGVTVEVQLRRLLRPGGADPAGRPR